MLVKRWWFALFLHNHGVYNHHIYATYRVSSCLLFPNRLILCLQIVPTLPCKHALILSMSRKISYATHYIICQQEKPTYECGNALNDWKGSGNMRPISKVVSNLALLFVNMHICCNNKVAPLHQSWGLDIHTRKLPLTHYLTMDYNQANILHKHLYWLNTEKSQPNCDLNPRQTCSLGTKHIFYCQTKTSSCILKSKSSCLHFWVYNYNVLVGLS